MKIHVYDTYTRAKNGTLMHFDIFLSEKNATEAYAAARAWLAEIGETETKLTQEECRFCHSEMANPDVTAVIDTQGYFILQMEGCPEPR
ncbi:MAG: DUF2024 family protein [Mariprofundaceae bacterium]